MTIKKFVLKIFRELIGRVIALISFLTSPKPVQRTSEQQQIANDIVSKMAIYQYFACPFCIKTRRTVRRLNIPMEYRDAQAPGGNHRITLQYEEGKIQVPCLRIEESGKSIWMYESSQIIDFLNRTFDPAHQQNA